MKFWNFLVILFVALSPISCLKLFPLRNSKPSPSNFQFQQEKSITQPMNQKSFRKCLVENKIPLIVAGGTSVLLSLGIRYFVTEMKSNNITDLSLIDVMSNTSYSSKTLLFDCDIMLPTTSDKTTRLDILNSFHNSTIIEGENSSHLIIYLPGKENPRFKPNNTSNWFFPSSSRKNIM